MHIYLRAPGRLTRAGLERYAASSQHTSQCVSFSSSLPRYSRDVAHRVSNPAQPASPSSARSTRTLGLIRIAFLVGVLVFGGVVWFVRRSGDASYAVDPRGMRIAGQAVWGLATLGTLGLFLGAGRASPERRASFAVTAWALGEATAIYGGLFWMMLGDPQWYLYGVACLLLTYFIFPIRTTR